VEAGYPRLTLKMIARAEEAVCCLRKPI